MENREIKDILLTLEEGVKNLFDSEKYKEYLKTMSKFHKYSYRNVMLILEQKKDASKVAGFVTWKSEFNRTVKKGETGIRILAPATFKKTKITEELNMETSKLEKEEKQVEYKYFRSVCVFDVGQTEGDPVPSLVTEITGTAENAKELIKILIKNSKTPIFIQEINNSEAKGYFSYKENKIVVKEGMGDIQTLKTLIHEIVHSRIHAGLDLKDKKREEMEVEAESVAYVVSNSLGIDTSEYSFGYIASWSDGKDLKELQKSLEVIQEESNNLIVEIKHKLELSRDVEKGPKECISIKDKIKSVRAFTELKEEDEKMTCKKITIKGAR